MRQPCYLTFLEVRNLEWDGWGAFLLESLGKNPLFHLFQLLETTHIPCLMGPHYSNLCLSCHIFLSTILLPSLLFHL